VDIWNSGTVEIKVGVFDYVGKMFWSNAATSSTIDTILDEPDVTLQKILEQDDILQELRAQNKKLVEFLSRKENINGMIDLVTSEPDSSLPLAAQYKPANVSCEVLTCDNSFAEKITAERAFLEKLFYFFRDKPSPINPLLASYVCRILSEMISRKMDMNWYSYQLNLIQIMGYLQQEPGIVEWLLNHLDCSAVCEFLYKLIMNVEGPDMRASLYQWLVERERLILRLMEKMTRTESEDVHANVSRLVGDLLYAFLDELMNSNQDRTDADPFLQALRSYETISTLLTQVFAPNAICETSVMHGLDLLLSLLGITRRSPRQSGRNDSLDEDNDGILFTEAIKNEILAVMPTLLMLLESPVDPYSIPLTSGVLEKPVGLGRLSIAKFIAHLFTLNDDQLNMGMIESGVLKQLLDLFWENPWNNFLHRYVCKILACVAKASNASPGSASYLMDMGILSKILEVFEDKKGLKVGYRGHLAKVASVWGEAAQADGNLKDLMKQLEEKDKELYSKWDAFYGDTLENYLSEEKVLLAGVHPPASGGLLSASSASSSMPYESDPASSMWDGSRTNSNLGGLGIDFDSISDTFSSVTIDGEDSKSKSRSIFEMFCNDKTSTFGLDGDEDEEKDDDDEDSLGDERWEDASQKFAQNKDNELFFKGSDDEDNSPSSVLPPSSAILGINPWSEEGGGGGGNGSGDPWSNDPAALDLFPALETSAMSAEWAKFDLNDVKQSNGGGQDDSVDEWANFESALSTQQAGEVAHETPTTPPQTEPCPEEGEKENGAKEGESATTGTEEKETRNEDAESKSPG